MLIIDTPDGIEYARLAALKGMLKLEGLGVRFKGGSVLRRVKREFGSRGVREEVILEVQAKMDEILARKGAR